MYLPIIKHRIVWFSLSLLLMTACVVALVRYPLALGIDFTGGSLMEVSFTEGRPDTSTLRQELAGVGFGEVLVQTSGDDGVLVRTRHLDEDGHHELFGTIAKLHPDAQEVRFESIGPSAGSELRRNAAWSVSAVLVAIALYVAYAFRKVSRPVPSWAYGIVTLLTALAHDVLIPVSVFAVLGATAGVEINSGFVAAILTVLGFSVHNTIVVFDRIRENLVRSAGTFEEIAERSVNETLARSVNTSFTSLLPLLAIYWWGGETLKYFALALIIGVVAGTYSSMFLAPPLLVAFSKRSSR